VYNRPIFDATEVGVEVFLHLGVGTEVNGPGWSYTHKVGTQASPESLGTFHFYDISANRNIGMVNMRNLTINKSNLFLEKLNKFKSSICLFL